MKVSKSFIMFSALLIGFLTTMQYSSLYETKENLVPARNFQKEDAIDALIANEPKLEIFLHNIEIKKVNINRFYIEHGKTLLQKLARAGKRRFVAQCLKLGAYIDAQDDNGWTALHNAVLSNSLPTVKILVKKGADLRIVDHQGRNVIDFVQEFSVDPSIQEYIESFAESFAIQKDDIVSEEQYPESLTF